MMKLHKIEVAAAEKELAIKFLKKNGFTTQTTFIGKTWWCDEVWKITWYADDMANHFGELLNYLRDIRQ
ncbi:hypothetical protein [Empedobacter falsenii]